MSESNGLFRSTNGGNSWAPVSGVSGRAGYDVEFKPGDPNTIYFSGTQVYRSTDSSALFTATGNFDTAGNAYKMMAVTPADSERLYVLEAKGKVFGAFYRSTDSGNTFAKTVDGSTINYLGYSPTGNDNKGQAPRDMDVAAHSFDADEVHIAGINT